MTNLIIGYVRHREHVDDWTPGAVPTTAIALLLSLLTSLLVADGAAASGRGNGFGRPGGYASIGVGGATESFDRNVFELEPGTAITLNGSAGYRASRFVAVEAAVGYTVRGFRSEIATSSGLGELDTQTLLGTGNLKLYLSDWRVQPFALGGIGGMYSTLDCTFEGVAVACWTLGLSSSDMVFAGRVGGGLDFYLTRNIALSGEIAYVMPTGALGDLRYVSFGGQVLVRF